MLRDLFAIDHRFASGSDRITIVKSNSHSVHVRFLGDVYAALFVEIEFEGFCIGRFEDHSGTVTHDAVVGQGERAVFVVKHCHHFHRRALEDAFFQNAATGQEPVLNGHVDGALAHIGFSVPRADKSLEPLEFRRDLDRFNRVGRDEPGGCGGQ